MGIVPVENRIGQCVPIRIGRIKLIHKGLVLENAQVAITLETWSVILMHILHADEYIERSVFLTVAYLHRRLINIVRVVILGVFKVRWDYKI